MSEIYEQVKTKRDAIDQIRRDFTKENDEYYQKRRQLEELEYEKRKVFSEAERLMVQAQQGQAKIDVKERKNPHEKEIHAANSLIAYLEQIVEAAAEDAQPAETGGKASAADLALLASLRKPSKKYKQRAKKAAKPTALAHSLGTLAQFDVVNLTPPATSDQVAAALDQLKQKSKEWTESFVRAVVTISARVDGTVQVSISLA
jgi:hypothetical protein